MKLEELLNPSLLEGKRLTVYENLLPMLLIEDGEGGDAGGIPAVGDSTGGPGDITGGPVKSPDVGTDTPTNPNGGWGQGPFTGFGGGRHWLNQFYNTVRNLVVLTKLSKRMKELGIGKEGSKRVKMAASIAAKNVKLLLSNPGATAYRIPQWTFDKPKTPIIKRWNEGFAYEFKKELAKLNEYQMLD